MGGNSAKLQKQAFPHSTGVICWKLRLDGLNHGNAFLKYYLHTIITTIFLNEVKISTIVPWRICHNYDKDV